MPGGECVSDDMAPSPCKDMTAVEEREVDTCKVYLSLETSFGEAHFCTGARPRPPGPICSSTTFLVSKQMQMRLS